MIYIAGSMRDVEYLRVIRDRVRALGCDVSSTWMDRGYQYGDRRCTRQHMALEAPRDRDEVKACSLFILNRRHRSVGKMVELGFALAYDRPVWVVGDPAVPCVFWGMADRVFKDWCSVFTELEKHNAPGRPVPPS